ncbi:MAG: lipase family protein [Mycobacterium sp.]|nr:lipase family protein [Mycobacterium sp.]
MQTASIVDVLGRYKGLTWQKLVIPAYPTPESLPLFVTLANKLIMGTGGTPTIPLFIGQGANGELEGTPGDKKDIGAGDGVMIAGDVRTLARDYCANGTKVHYEQYDLLGHISSVAPWLLHSIAWIQQRFADLPAPQNCSSIHQGNPLEPIPMPSPQIL